MLQDQEILKLLHTDASRGMDALFKRYYRPLVVFADAYLHDLTGAEDLVQEQIVKLWSGQVFTNVATQALSTFLFTVVKNACINWIEKKKLPLTRLDMPHFQIAWEEASTMDDMVRDTVLAALEQLPGKTRKVVECVMMNDRSYKEAAEELGVSVNTVKTLLRQGMKELRERLKEKEGYLVLFFLKSLSH